MPSLKVSRRSSASASSSRYRLLERCGLHRAHGAYVGIAGDPSQLHAGRRGGIHQCLRLADHDRLWFVWRKPVVHQRIVQAWRTVMAAGFPLDPGNAGVPAVVGQGLRDPAVDRRDICSGQIPVGDEASSAGERDQPQRAKAGNRSALGVSASVRSCSSYAASRLAIWSMRNTLTPSDSHLELPAPTRMSPRSGPHG